MWDGHLVVFVVAPLVCYNSHFERRLETWGAMEAPMAKGRLRQMSCCPWQTRAMMTLNKFLQDRTVLHNDGSP